MIKLKDILMESLKDWFSGSKVTDSHGNPLRMYHGTHEKKNFSVFNAELRGAWFTANPKEAGAYAGGGYLNKSRKYGRTIPVFLNIKNPMKFTEAEFDRLLDTWDRFNTYKKDMSDLKKKAMESGYDGFHFMGSKPEYDIYVAFYANQIRSSITLNEAESSGTFTMYHGGKRWLMTPDSLQPGVKGRYEGGVGIYFTNSYNTARKYAKGNKVVHLVEIYKQFKDIDNVRVAVEKITDFVKNVPQLSSKKEIITDIASYSTRVGKSEIPLSILNNLVVNYQAARGKSGVYIAKFFSENGADGHVQKQNGDEIWLVVFNPKILKSVKVVNPKEINSDSQFMLPATTSLNETAVNRERPPKGYRVTTPVVSKEQGVNWYDCQVWKDGKMILSSSMSMFELKSKAYEIGIRRAWDIHCGKDGDWS